VTSHLFYTNIQYDPIQ
jgi:hypothetical protein